MVAHRVKVRVDAGGTIVLQGLPLREGDHVELIVLQEEDASSSASGSIDADSIRYPLRGKQPFRFDDPFSPAVAPEDWDSDA